MSSIYIQEPPTSGKVLLVTSVGDIDIELWSKEAPKACKNFIQLCMEGYYNGTIFHRVVKGFIVQGGDPTGTGTGGESIYGEPFKDEFHTRLRFVRRGLVAMANAGENDNGSQFFFTMGTCPELQNKHTIFGKVTGETLYNMLKLEEGLIEDEDRPAYPQKIIKTEVLNNPFSDIIPRNVVKSEKKSEKKREKKTGVKNFKLLSFGDQAEEDEEETIELNRNYVGKSKSTHDLLDDPKLSSVPAVEKKSQSRSSSSSSLSGDEEVVEHNTTESLDKIKEKLKRTKQQSESSESEEYDFHREEVDKKRKKKEEIQNEIKQFKKNYHEERKAKDQDKEVEDKEEKKRKKMDKADNEMMVQYNSDLKKFQTRKEKMPKKGASRESFTMDLLAKFRNKLATVREQHSQDEEKKTEVQADDDEDDVTGDDWMAENLEFVTPTPVLAKDASTKDDEWFDITDPRNAINKRRRENSKNILKSREKRTH